MAPQHSALLLVHLLGMALGTGAATAKLVLLVRARSDRTLLPVFLAVARPVTRLIILGMVLVTASGAGWMIRGYPLSPFLTLKLVLVGALWALGPIIDNVVEPRFRALVPPPGGEGSVAFERVFRWYLFIEVLATGLFYLVISLWVLG